MRELTMGVAAPVAADLPRLRIGGHEGRGRLARYPAAAGEESLRGGGHVALHEFDVTDGAVFHHLLRRRDERLVVPAVRNQEVSLLPCDCGGEVPCLPGLQGHR